MYILEARVLRKWLVSLGLIGSNLLIDMRYNMVQVINEWYITFYKFIDITLCISSFFPFVAEEYSIVCHRYSTIGLSIYLLIDIWIENITNRVAINILPVHVFVHTHILIGLD